MTIADLTFSLVVNTVNRAGPLRTLLRTLEHQSYSHFEVIVVVGPTTDNTLEVLSEYEGRVRVLRCPEANLSQSRNIGLLAAHGDIVAYIDDDAVPCQRWLEQLARLFGDPGLDATGGTMHLIYPEHPTVQYRLGIISSLLEQVDVCSSWLEHIVPPGMGRQWLARMTGSNMAFRRQALLEVGGFDEFFVFYAEEADVIIRLANSGHTVHPVREAVVYNVPVSSQTRVMFNHIRRWRLQIRSTVYFGIKNGRSAGDSWRSIAQRCLYLLHGRWMWFGQLWREGELSFSQMWRTRFQESFAAWNGMIHGLFATRKLIHASSIQSSCKEHQPILRFQNDDSARQASVDPISGPKRLVSLPDPPLRLCLLSNTYPPEQFGGIGRLTNLMARGLSERGHMVHVVARGERDQVSFYDGAYVHRIPYRTDRYSRYHRLTGLHHCLNYSHAVYEKVRRLMLNEGIQIVDSPIWLFEGLVTAVSGIAPVVVRLVTAFRQVARLQDERGEDARLMGEMERTLIERANHVLPNTQATLDAVRQAYGVQLAENRYTIVPYGIVPVPDEDIRPFDLKRAADNLTVLYVGRLERRKGTLDLFQTIPQVLKQVPNARFVIAGSDNSKHDGFQHRTGMDYPTYFAQRYREFIPYVQFMGMVSDETLQALYQSCDLFVAPSLYESFGLIYLEAMNYAKPVIGCHVGGVPEVVEHGVTGLLVDPEAAPALAQAIVSMLGSPTRLHEVGMAGRQRLIEKFTYIQMARNFERVYRTVIQKSSGGASPVERQGEL
jgi:glycogen(starch) synthase